MGDRGVVLGGRVDKNTGWTKKNKLLKYLVQNLHFVRKGGGSGGGDMGLQLCVHVCVYVCTKGSTRVRWGGRGGVRSRRCGDKFKSFRRIQQKTKIGHASFFFFFLHSLRWFLRSIHCIKYRVPFDSRAKLLSWIVTSTDGNNKDNKTRKGAESVKIPPYYCPLPPKKGNKGKKKRSPQSFTDAQRNAFSD